MRTALIFIAQRGYQNVELQGVRDALRAAGFAVTLCSKEAGECRGKYDGTEQAEIAMRDAHMEQYDRVAFIGGPGAGAYAEDPEAQALARAAAQSGMPLGAICMAPVILAAAGVLQSKRATVWNEDGRQEAALQAGGAAYTGEAVTLDGRLVTGNGSAAAAEFGKAFAALPSAR